MVFGDVAGGHEVVGDLFEGEDGDEVDAGGFEGVAAAFLAVDEGDGVADDEAGGFEGGGGLEDGAAAGDEVVDNETALAANEEPFDDVGFIGSWGVDVDHGDVDEEGEGGCDVEAAEGYACDEGEGLDVGVAHRHECFEFFFDDARAAFEGFWVGDEATEVDVDGGVDGGATEGEVAEFDGVEFPEFFGKPEVAGRPGGFAQGSPRGMAGERCRGRARYVRFFFLACGLLCQVIGGGWLAG